MEEQAALWSQKGQAPSIASLGARRSTVIAASAGEEAVAHNLSPRRYADAIKPKR
jgi:hypothetical protein